MSTNLKKENSHLNPLPFYALPSEVASYLASGTSSLPSTASRRRRPGAEELELRPTSAPSRTRRKIFGAPQRANKLLIPLDNDSDSSDSETEEDKAMARQKRVELLRRLADEKQNSPGPFPFPLAIPSPLPFELMGEKWQWQSPWIAAGRIGGS